MAAQDQLTAARDLYAAAAYEDALTVLNRMLIEPGSPEDRPRIEQLPRVLSAGPRPQS